MRSRITNTLSEMHNLEIGEIKEIITSCKKITPYNYKNVKGRKVIDKEKIFKNESVSLDYYKNLLNIYGNIKFPNRSAIMSELMNVMPDMHKYHAYTIYKFDIMQFFYNVDSRKSWIHIDNLLNLHPHEREFFSKYVKVNKNLMPGIGLHNSMIEVLGNYFDIKVKESFNDNCIFYSRYVDDGIIILDEVIPLTEIEDTISKLLKSILGKNIKLNNLKTKYFNKSYSRIEFEYLGYQFSKKQKSSFDFGIAKSKIDKYKEKMEKYIDEYKRTRDEDILDFQLDILFKRIVFYGSRKNNNTPRWQVRGISDSYKELKRFMKNTENISKITPETVSFFEKAVIQSFGKLREPIPQRINNKIVNKRYLSNFCKNRTILIHPKLGWRYIDLKNCLENIYKVDTTNKSYLEIATIFFNKYK